MTDKMPKLVTKLTKFARFSTFRHKKDIEKNRDHNRVIKCDRGESIRYGSAKSKQV